MHTKRYATALAALTALAAVLFLLGCGSVSSHSNITGNWQMTANSSTAAAGSAPALQFIFAANESAPSGSGGGTNSVSISNLNFSGSNNCFDNGATPSATIAATPSSGSSNGGRAFTLTLTSAASASGTGVAAGNVATFTINVGADNNSGSGTYTITAGPAPLGGTNPCANDSGTATMTRH